MSKKLFLAVLPFLALAMASCSRGNGGAGSSSKAPESSEPASEESSEGSEDSSDSSDSSEEGRVVPVGELSPHTFTIGTTDYELYEDPDFNSGTDFWGGEAKFTSVAIDVTEGDAIAVTANPDGGTPVSVYANSYNKSNNVSGTEPGAYTVKASAEDVVLTLYQYEDGWAFNLESPESESGEGEEGGDTAPTSGYAIVINGTKYVSFSEPSTWDLDPSYQQCSVLGVSLEENDVITFYDGTNAAGWTDAVIDPASVTGFVLESGVGIKVPATGLYDIYFKLKMGSDNVYFGPHA